MAAFERFCGKPNDSLSRILLLTTLWQETDAVIGSHRSMNEIRSKYWRDPGPHIVGRRGLSGRWWTDYWDFVTDYECLEVHTAVEEM
jgi:hypothetical protein